MDLKGDKLVILDDIKKLNVDNPNEKCGIMIDIIFNKIIDVMNKDKKTSGFEKALVVSTTKRVAPGIKKYVLELPKEDAQDIIDKIKSVI